MKTLVKTPEEWTYDCVEFLENVCAIEPIEVRPVVFIAMGDIFRLGVGRLPPVAVTYRLKLLANEVNMMLASPKGQELLVWPEAAELQTEEGLAGVLNRRDQLDSMIHGISRTILARRWDGAMIRGYEELGRQLTAFDDQLGAECVRRVLGAGDARSMLGDRSLFGRAADSPQWLVKILPRPSHKSRVALAQNTSLDMRPVGVFFI